MRPLLVLIRRFDAFVRRLGAPRADRLAVGLATVLAATSIGPHRALDDYVLALIARGKGAPVGLARGTLDLFAFTTGDAGSNHRLMDVGLMLPWWTDEHLRIAFFRPLTSFTHVLDERLWPSSVALMHAHSLVWFVALLLAARLVYRRLESSPIVAGLALLLYAIDDAHGPALAWLANRNALVAGTFGCLSLALHDAWRREGRAVAALLAPGAFVIGLLAGEFAVGALGYLVAYAALLDRDRWKHRVLSLAPYAAAVAAWRVLWSGGGYGAKGSGAYLIPLSDPVPFLAALPRRLLVLLHGQFSVPPSDLAFLAPPAHQPLIAALAVVTCAVVAWLILPILRSDPRSRFWALGMALSLLPLGATFPGDRLLLFVGLGAMALLARLFVEWAGRGARGELGLGARTVATGAFVVLHLVVAPALLPLRAAQMELFGAAHDRGAGGIPRDVSVAERTVVIVAAPTMLFASYIQAARELEGVPRPAHLYVLATASSVVEVERSGPSALTVRPARGFLYTPLDQHYRAALSMDLGERVVLSAMTAEVVARGADGRPAAVEFSFPRRPSEYLFLKWEGGRFVPFELPALGRRETLAQEDFGRILMATALRGI